MPDVLDNLDLVGIMLSLKAAVRCKEWKDACAIMVDVITDIGQHIIRLEDAVFETPDAANDDEGGSEDG